MQFVLLSIMRENKWNIHAGSYGSAGIALWDESKESIQKINIISVRLFKLVMYQEILCIPWMGEYLPLGDVIMHWRQFNQPLLNWNYTVN